MKATLSVKDLDNGKTENIALTTGKQGFTGQFKVGNASGYEAVVKAEDQSFFRETEPQKITVQTAAKAPAAPKQTKEEKPFPWIYVVLAVIGALILAALIYFLLKVAKEKNRGFSGQMVIEVRDEDTGERSNPQYKRLKGFKGKFQLHQLLGLHPEFAETNQIIFKPAAGDALLIINNSNCTIEKSGRAIDAKKGQIVKRNDRLRIVLKQVNKSIYIEYIS